MAIIPLSQFTGRGKGPQGPGAQPASPFGGNAANIPIPGSGGFSGAPQFQPPPGGLQQAPQLQLGPRPMPPMPQFQQPPSATADYAGQQIAMLQRQGVNSLFGPSGNKSSLPTMQYGQRPMGDNAPPTMQYGQMPMGQQAFSPMPSGLFGNQSDQLGMMQNLAQGMHPQQSVGGIQGLLRSLFGSGLFGGLNG